MSAPTVNVDVCTVSGTGLALAGVSVEQDSAYWEWHIEIPSKQEKINGDEMGGDDSYDDFDDEDDEFEAVKFGVCTKKSQAFYKAMAANEEGDDVPMQHFTIFMRSIPKLTDGDVVGVAVQQSDLPMIQFLVNGEPLHEIAINRFRGSVYPSIMLCEGVTATAVMGGADFKHTPPHARFGPLIAARGII
eukprot:CAMPEP_0195520586 /NCGR_PEP_ID=MMETSP0794_2-20130614/17223_1 /TAXON_ID=515487 /ORGANISM="Stephanopyxis turris, Strain CCMP 815" /LENGTH=188 /DNA_ID=CAMNT_0040649973 /DNA_START=235 /DNA_END=801 /DNA_ORIENTATION=-